jgi:L-ascorbate metabolism protein UlaG (beta-lactamase superfamily)
MAAGTSVVGGTSWWLSFSNSRTARWSRRILADATRRTLPAQAKPNPSAWSDNQLTLAWLGHSTVLINFYGIHILTDPVLGNRVGVSLGLGTVGPKRYIAPALQVKELPRLDVVLLSHAHMDHMDLATLGACARDAFTVSASATSDVLASAQLNQITELSWGERTTFRNRQGELEIEAVEVKHWGERWPSSKARGFNGYIMRREGRAILFAGDTAFTPLLGALRSRRPFEAAIMPIGAYQPWIWNHCNPEQALEMANAAGAKYILPVHHQTFRLSNEPMREPIERLQTALQREPERLALQSVGETFICPKV